MTKGKANSTSNRHAARATEYCRIMDVTEPVPIENRLGTFELRAYLVEEKPNVFATHLTMGRGDPVNGMLARLNSACLTSEAFGCERCDCNWQMWQALEVIGNRGGMMIYHPNHEGRGVGLFHKLKSYGLMDRLAKNTAEAFDELGYERDSRSFDAAVAIFRHLGVEEVRLMTNNPDKLRALRSHGIRAQAEPIVAEHNERWQGYLQSKAREFGHLISLGDQPLAAPSGW